jgi:hypothetical protein
VTERYLLVDGRTVSALGRPHARSSSRFGQNRLASSIMPHRAGFNLLRSDGGTGRVEGRRGVLGATVAAACAVGGVRAAADPAGTKERSAATDADRHPNAFLLTDLHLVWRLGGEAVVLRITGAGRQAIGVADEPGSGAVAGTEIGELSEAEQEAAQAAPDAGIDPTAPDALDHDAVAGGVVAEEAAQAAHTGRATALRGVAAAVLTAWDDEAGQRASLAGAIEALRAAIPAARATRQPRPEGAPRSPRQGTKQEAVLALLRRPEGASGPDIAAATGWAPHTVRGFLAGLEKRGVAVLVHERVRQVGPGKEGAKGSFTVYRVAAEPAG